MIDLPQRTYWSAYETRLADRAVQSQTSKYIGDVLGGRLADVSSATASRIHACLEARAQAGLLPDPYHDLVPLDPDALAEAWVRMPILTRSGLEIATSSHVPLHCEKLVRTGGSSGEPVGLFIAPEGFRSKRSRLLASRKAMGWRPGMPTVGIWGSDADIGAPQSFSTRFLARLSGISLDGGFAADPQRWRRLAARIEKLGPQVAVYGYSTLLRSFCEELLSQGRRLPTVNVAWNGAEPVDSRLRTLVSSVTNATLHNFYGARETGAMAVELNDAGLVALGPDILLEVVDENGRHVDEGAGGRIVVSVLTRSGSALLRYEIGDLAVAGPRFGFGHSMLRALNGRTNDVIPLPNGSRVSGIFMNHLMKDFGSIIEFQLVVDSRERTATLYVVSREDSGDDLRQPLQLVARRLDGYDVCLERVSAIARTRHGKLRNVIVT